MTCKYLRLTLVGLVALGCLPARDASADLRVPGQHSQTTDVTLDFGPYADYSTGLHKIAAGDTLQSIAQARLGASSRWNEIQALNPDAKPKKLAIGSVLLLPPVKSPLPAPKTGTKGEAKAPKTATGRQHWWHLYSAPRVSMHLHRFAHGQKIPVNHYDSDVFAIRNDGVKAFEGMLAKHKGSASSTLRDLRRLQPTWFAAANHLHVGRGSAKDSDPVWRIEKDLRITLIAQGRIDTQVVATRYFDKNGKKLSEKEIARSKRDLNILLILIAAGGLAGLFYVLRRRTALTTTPHAA